MICKNDITSLKENIGERIGEKIIIKGSLGRNKPFEKEATVEAIYPSQFRIKYDGHFENTSYQYIDVLKSEIEVYVNDGEGFAPIVPVLDPKMLGKKNRYLQV